MLRSFSFVVEEAVTEQPADLIEVTSPKEHALVSNPLMVEGRARGGWYFEGSFPVQLLASTGEKLAEVPAMAQGEWMTEEFTPFVVSLSFDAGTATSGTLVLMKSNPSGLSEHDTSVTIPVEFVNE
jgi:hypothetical protein